MFKIVQREGPPLPKQRIAWLREAHHLGSVTAKIIADRQFAVIKPTARSGIDVGFALPGVKASGRLKSRSVGSDRMTHSFAVTSRLEIDAELQKWLRKAYEKDG